MKQSASPTRPKWRRIAPAPATSRPGPRRTVTIAELLHAASQSSKGGDGRQDGNGGTHGATERTAAGRSSPQVQNGGGAGPSQTVSVKRESPEIEFLGIVRPPVALDSSGQTVEKGRKPCRGGCGKSYSRTWNLERHWEHLPLCESRHAAAVKGTPEEHEHRISAARRALRAAMKVEATKR